LEVFPPWEEVPPFSDGVGAIEDDDLLAVVKPRLWVRLVLFGGGGPI
jgi:hypothetical protein